mmetsp:Transcript_17479/g.55020  ORF Transcript_17479/g.55020 Transcript_17479/m.55020 type:complete len:233 (-) Transcript_17479:736-1434(-)
MTRQDVVASMINSLGSGGVISMDCLVPRRQPSLKSAPNHLNATLSGTKALYDKGRETLAPQPRSSSKATLWVSVCRLQLQTVDPIKKRAEGEMTKHNETHDTDTTTNTHTNPNTPKDRITLIRLLLPTKAGCSTGIVLFAVRILARGGRTVVQAEGRGPSKRVGNPRQDEDARQCGLQLHAVLDDAQRQVADLLAHGDAAVQQGHLQRRAHLLPLLLSSSVQGGDKAEGDGK